MPYTRKQHMNGDCTHQEFYAQMVTQSVTNYVVSVIGGERLIKSTDEHLNDIPLVEWDAMQMAMRPSLHLFQTKFDPDYSGGVSLSDCVCLAKAAAKQWMRECGL